MRCLRNMRKCMSGKGDKAPLGHVRGLNMRLYEYNFITGESKIHIKCDRKEAIWAAVAEIRDHREALVKYLRMHPEFQYTLRPISPLPDAPRIIRLMTEASSRADVGPIAAVAGALADIGLEAMLKMEAKVALVENGGEIAVYTEKPLIVSLFSNDPKFSNKIGFLIERDDCPLGLATSSSRTDRALSLGEADSATIIADNASTADAAATAVCNSVFGNNIEESIRKGLERAKVINGVRGALIIRSGHSGLYGKLPRIIKIT